MRGAAVKAKKHLVVESEEEKEKKKEEEEEEEEEKESGLVCECVNAFNVFQDFKSRTEEELEAEESSLWRVFLF